MPSDYRRPLRVEIVVCRLLGEAGVARGRGAAACWRTLALRELEVRAERARLLEVLREHLVPSDVGVRRGDFAHIRLLFELCRHCQCREGTEIGGWLNASSCSTLSMSFHTASHGTRPVSDTGFLSLLRIILVMFLFCNTTPAAASVSIAD